MMRENNLGEDVLSLFQFIKIGIEQREYSKFIFTKNLSQAIELVALLGEKNGFTRDEMSYFSIYELKNLYTSAVDVKEVIESQFN